MDLETFLQTCAALNIKFEVKDDELGIEADPSVLKEEFVIELKSKKLAIIAWLKSQQQSATIAEKKIKRRGAEHEPAQLSFSQQRLWLLDRLEPARGQYNIPAIFELTGPLDLPALKQAFTMIVARHDILRTVYQHQGNEVRQLVHAAADFIIKQHDLSELAVSEQLKKLQQNVKSEVSTPFELSTDAMLRVTLYRISEQESHMLVVMHHIGSDAWSIKVLLNELSEAYSAILAQRQPMMSPLLVQYADFAHWQRNWLSGDNLELHLDYWRGCLADAPLLHSLPLDASRPAEQSHSGEVQKKIVPHQLRLQLEALARQHQTGLYSILHATFVYLLRLYSGETDIVIGTPVANREQVELAPLIGIFVNSLVLRSDLSQIRELPSLIEHSKQVLLDAYVHQNLPFEKLVEELNPERSLSHHPLFQVMLSLQPYGEIELVLPGLEVVSRPLSSRTTKLDLYLNVTELVEGFEFEWEYATDLFLPQRIDQLHEQFISLLESFVANPLQRLSGSFEMSENECQQLIELGNGGQQLLLASNFIESVTHQATESPFATAAVDPVYEISYRELEQQSNGLAHYLIFVGIRAGDSVAVVAEHKITSLIQLLAVLKTGASYVPIDPEIPARSLVQIIEQSQIRFGIVAEQQLSKFKDMAEQCHWLASDVLNVESTLVPPQSLITADTIAYQIFTSGSTGQPKGVQVSHLNLINYLTAAQQLYQMQPGESVLQFASLSFDASIEEIMLTLSQGGKLIYRHESCKSSSEDFWQWINKLGINLVSLPTAFWHTLSATLNEKYAAIASKNLRGCIIGGESAQRNLISNWLTQTGVTVFNTYGPTETTVVATAQVYRADEQSDNDANVIGRPMVNYRCLILDSQQHILPVGVPGELYIGGDSVSIGYAGAPQLNLASFVTFSNFGSSQRFYRTGDRVRWRDDGTIEYLGRLDQQLKIGSFRVEPGAITEELLQHLDIKEAFVTAKGEPKRLVAYVVTAQPSIWDEDKLLTWLKGRLPSYMVPSALVELDKLPMTRNGKVNVTALPQPLWQSVDKYRAPRNELEKQLVAIWSNLLGVLELGIDHNFFHLGGNSLLAVQLISEIRQQLNYKVPSRAILEKPTIAEFIGEMVEITDVEQDSITWLHDEAGRYEPFPLTEVQRAYWLGRGNSFELGNVGTHGYTELPIPTRLLPRFEQAWRYLIERHDMLRMVLTENGEQRILAETPEYQFVHHDMQKADEAAQTAHFEDMRGKFSHHVFNGEQWPLFNIQLTRCSSEKTVIHFSIDALIVDASSLMFLGNELAQLLDNPNMQLPPQRITFRDYVLATNERKGSVVYHEAQQYWCDRVSDFPSAPLLPLQVLPADIREPKFERRTRCLESTSWQKLQNIAKAFQLTPTCLLLGCLGEVLNRWSEQPHFALNLTLFRRENIHPDVIGLVGDFTSLSLLEMDFRDTDSRFIDRLKKLQSRLWNDIEHSAFDGMSMQKAIKRHHGHNLTYPVVLTSTLGLDHREHDAPRLEDQLGIKSLTQGLYAITQTSQVWLDVKVTEGSGALYCDWDSVQGLFPEQMLDHMMDAFWQLIMTVCEAPMTLNERVVIELPVAQQELVIQINNTAQFFENGPLFAPVMARAEQQPDAIAVQTLDLQLSYRELAWRSHVLACQLVEQGCSVGDRIAIVMVKGWQQVVAILGIQQAGGAYLPIDAMLPPERIAMLLELGEVSHVVSTERMISFVPVEYSTLNLDQWAEWPKSDTALPEVAPSDLAYIIFTSGSTGVPKGVMMDHQAVFNTIQGVNKRFDVTADDRVLGLSSLSFDLSVYDIFGVLAAGGTLVLPAADELRDPTAWLIYLERFEITIWNTVPALLQMLLDHTDQQLDTRMRLVMLSGDWIATDMPSQINRTFPKAKVISLGGATEAAIWSIYYPITEVGTEWVSVPYGRPLSNQQFYVMNQALEHCPIHVEGDLYIAGDGLALGYWREQEKTAQSFFSHPLTQQRLYRTGDRGRWMADGDIEFLGRKDSQVKLRGYRIELGEIMHQLKQHPAIQACEVMLHKASVAHKQLVAYLILEESMQGCDEVQLQVQLQDYLSNKLPEYMIPVSYMFLAAWPLSTNGKLDRKALPEPVSGRLLSEIQTPQTEAERELAEIWSELLRIPLSQLSIEANFFELGGDSILAIQVVSRAAKKGLKCKVKDIFTGQSIRQLAQSISVIQNIVGEQQIAGEITLLPIQQEFLTNSNEVHYFNQAVLLTPPSSMMREDLAPLLAKLLHRHDALRLKFSRSGELWQGEYRDYSESLVQRVQVFHDWNEDNFEALASLATKIQASLDPEQGDLFRAAWVENNSAQRRLLVVIHHLAVDGVSWRILLEDLELLWSQYQQKVPLVLAAKTTSYQQWGEFLERYGQKEKVHEEQAFWLAQCRSETPSIEDIAKQRYPEEALSSGRHTLRERITAVQTQVLLQQCNRRYRSQINELLLAGCFGGVQSWGGITSLGLDIESHGRELLAEHIDLSQTVGWFTSSYPLLLNSEGRETGDLICNIKEQYRKVPNNGIGFGVLKYLTKLPVLAQVGRHELSFNYLGQFDQFLNNGQQFDWAREPSGDTTSAQQQALHRLIFTVVVVDEQLEMSLEFSGEHYSTVAMTELLGAVVAATANIIEHCRQSGVGRLTVSDFPLAKIDTEQLTDWQSDGELEDVYPVTGMQRGMLFHSMMDPESYITQTVLTFEDLNVEIFQQAWCEVVQRQAIFRSRFVGLDSANPLQLVYKNVALPWQLIDLSVLATDVQNQKIEQLRCNEKAAGFDPQQAPLMRMCLIRTAEGLHCLIWTVHHALMDGWCVSLIYGEVRELYDALLKQRTAQLSEVVLYRNYVTWLEKQDRQLAQDYWRESLAEVTAITPLPFTQSRQASADESGVHTLKVNLTEAVSSQLAERARTERITINVLFQAAWSLLLSRYADQSLVVFGATSAGRPAELPQVEQMIGLFINTLPVVVEIDEQASVHQWLQGLHHQIVEREQFSYLPLAEIQRQSQIQSELFQSILVFENYPFSEFETHTSALRMTDVSLYEGTNYGLSLTIYGGSSLVIKMDVDQCLMNPDEAAQILAHLQHLLSQLTAELPEKICDLSLFHANEQTQLQHMLQGPVDSTDFISMPAMFAAQVASNHDDVALIDGNSKLSYGELANRVTNLTLALQAEGVKPGERVGLSIERSADMLIALLAIQSAGAAYVPLDPTYPVERLKYMVEDAQLKLIITESELASLFENTVAICRDVSELLANECGVVGSYGVMQADDPAYVIYTSGSTGRPKGVVVSHGNLTGFLRSMAQRPGINNTDRLLAVTSISFDIHTLELLLPLVSGATVVLANEHQARSAEELSKLISAQSITIMQATPVTWELLLQLQWQPEHPFVALCGGEALNSVLKEQLVALPKLTLWNMYGPTETTVWSSVARLGAGEPVHLGTPIHNTAFYICDRYARLMPLHACGELYIAGAGVAMGYYGQPELSAERFAFSPHSSTVGERWYRTGDLVRLDEHGRLLFVARVDQQIKRQGYRIELGEIESLLQQHSQVDKAIVTISGERHNLNAHLVISNANNDCTLVEQLRHYLADHLPGFMLPSMYRIWDQLPMTANGKVDRKQLIAVKQNAIPHLQPQTEVQQRLTHVITELLMLETIGIEQSFFELGGDSLLAVQLIGRVNNTWLLDLHVREVFEHPTVRSLATLVEQLLAVRDEYQQQSESEVEFEEGLI